MSEWTVARVTATHVPSQGKGRSDARCQAEAWPYVTSNSRSPDGLRRARGRCGSRGARTPRRPGLQPPGGAADRRRPAESTTPTSTRSSARTSQDTVTLIANWIPFEEPNGGPNFYTFATDARYDINIDNNGDARPDVTYSWTFQNHYRDARTRSSTTPARSRRLTTRPELLPDLHADARSRRTARRDACSSDKIVAPSDVGTASMPDYARLRKQDVTEGRLPGGGADLRRAGRRPVLPRPAGLRPALRRQLVGGRRTTPSPATTSTRSRCRCRSPSWR